MKRVGILQSIQFKIIMIMILLLLLAIQVIGAYFAQGLETELKKNFEDTLDERIDVLSYNIRDAILTDRTEDALEQTLEQDIASILALYGQSETYMKLQVVDRQFRIIGTNNQEDLGKLVTGESSVRPSIISGAPSRSILRDATTGDRHLVKIHPLSNDDDEPIGAMYLEASMEGIYEQLSSINTIFLNGTFIAIFISAIVGVLVARSITKPITEMREQAQILASGDFSQKVNVYGTDEIGQLAVTFNEMKENIKIANYTTEEERRKLSSVLSNMSDGVISTNETGMITLMNDPAAILIRQSFDQVQNKSIFDVLNLDEETIKLIKMQDSSSITIDFTGDGVLVLNANFTVVQDEFGQYSGFIIVISDVTEQEKVEQERREFVSNVSHELRTPLTTMRSYLEALTEGAWKNTEIAPRFLEVTQNETERMIRLVNDLLQLSRMDYKDQELIKERVNVIPFFHHILDRFDMNKDDRIEIERSIPRESIFLWMNKDHIIQVVDNIMSNALKYSPKHESVRFKLTKERNRIKVMVADNGPGIPPEKLDKIFERFYRADAARSRKRGGTGLGLAIAKEIIHSHQGQIWAESIKGQGTKVFFSLPLIAQQQGD